MTPYFQNDNDHHIRVKDENGELRRIAPGTVVKASGTFADNLEETRGVSESNEEAYDAHVESLRGPGSDRTAEDKLTDGIANLRTDARLAAVAVPLARVVGDDNAPEGPGSGTITTKQAVAEGGGRAEKGAFAQGERLPSEVGNEKLTEIEHAQAENSARVAEIGAEVYPDATPPATSPDGPGRSDEAPGAPDETPADQLKGEALDSEVERLELDLPSDAKADDKRAAVKEEREARGEEPEAE